MSMKKIVLASVLGGLAIFFWGAVSHVALPLYNNSLLRFTNEEAVTQAIVANAPNPGVYFMPNNPVRSVGMSDEQYKAATQASMDRMMQGPFMFASIRLGPASTPGLYITQIFTDMLTAFFMTLILVKLSEKTYWSRVIVCLWIGLAGFMAKSLPMWNWYGFSPAFTFAELIDFTGRAFVGGMVISKFTSSK
ncbi:MAG: hypothetical protein ACHQQQ_00405 [Bacteroidota bacterium]